MTSSKWQLLHYFIVYVFLTSFKKSRRNNQIFEDLVSFFIRFNKNAKFSIIFFSKIENFGNKLSLNYSLNVIKN